MLLLKSSGTSRGEIVVRDLRSARHRRMDVETVVPTLVTTSQMLTTGVDVLTCKNVVLARVINSMTDFKQIIGRGTRVRDDYYVVRGGQFVSGKGKFVPDEGTAAVHETDTQQLKHLLASLAGCNKTDFVK